MCDLLRIQKPVYRYLPVFYFEVSISRLREEPRTAHALMQSIRSSHASCMYKSTMLQERSWDMCDIYAQPLLVERHMNKIMFIYIVTITSSRAWLGQRSCCGSVDKTTDSHLEVPNFNLLTMVVVPLGKALYPHCINLGKDLKPFVIWLLAFLVAR